MSSIRLSFRKKDWSGTARFSLWFNRLVFPLWTLWAFILPYFSIQNIVIPSLEQLHVSYGEISNTEPARSSKRKMGEEGIILTEKSGRHRYGCWGGYLSSNCYTKTRIKYLAGLPAEVWWFERPTFSGSRERHLVRLVVSGREEVTYESSLRNFARDKEFPLSALVFILISVVGEVCIRLYYYSVEE